jgi:hypothetical protein
MSLSLCKIHLVSVETMARFTMRQVSILCNISNPLWLMYQGYV